MAGSKKPAHAKAPERRERPRTEVHPKITERRRQVRDAQTSRRWGVLTGVAVAIVAAALVAVVIFGPLLRVHHVEVVGNRATPTASIVAAAGLSSQPPMVTMDASAVAARVEALPWVLGAEVTRVWPQTVRITVTERTAVAAVAGQDGLVLVDGAGRILGVDQGGTLPRLVLGLHAGAPGSFLPSGVRPAAAVAASLPPAFKDQVSSISLEDGQLSLELTTPVRFVLGSSDDLEAKFEAVAAVIAHAQLYAGDVVDVTVPQSVVIRHGG